VGVFHVCSECQRGQWWCSGIFCALSGWRVAGSNLLQAAVWRPSAMDVLSHGHVHFGTLEGEKYENTVVL